MTQPVTAQRIYTALSVQAEPDAREIIRMPLPSNPLVLAWASCGTRLAILESGGPP